MRINFIHLDLGLGGAERLIVDAACSLKLRGHSVRIITSFHDPTRCFEETNPNVNGLLSRDIRCLGDWIPRNIYHGKFHLLFACIRMYYISFWLANTQDPQIIIVDQVSFLVPFLKLISPGIPILFYCHYPDKLLAPTHKVSILRRLYRSLFDKLEEFTTKMADKVVVNSEFTGKVVQQVFPEVAKVHSPLEVVYPCVDLSQLDETKSDSVEFEQCFTSQPRIRGIISERKTFMLSINRFERKKGLDLAIRALKLVNNSGYLVITGGYDVRVKENVDHLKELQRLVDELELKECVFFLPSCSSEEKRLLLHHCRVLLYTPINEHFGIVPIEAGAMGKPVIACNSGGPLESIEHLKTGMLVDPKPEAFANAMEAFLSDDGMKLSIEMGKRARERISQKFSRETFGKTLENMCIELNEKHAPWRQRRRIMTYAIEFVVIFTLVLSLCYLIIQIFPQKWIDKIKDRLEL
jgi:alpha-1,3/alpha-1,6-mannosyltransferase